MKTGQAWTDLYSRSADDYGSPSSQLP